MIIILPVDYEKFREVINILIEQFKNLFDPSTALGAFLISFVAGIAASFFGGYKLGKYVKKNNCIDILEIPYSTSIEAIMKKLVDLIKEGKLKEVTDMRDEIDLKGFKLTLDLRRGTEPDKLMA